MQEQVELRLLYLDLEVLTFVVEYLVLLKLMVSVLIKW